MIHFSSQLNISSQEVLSEVCWSTDVTAGCVSGSSSLKQLDVSHQCDLEQWLSLSVPKERKAKTRVKQQEQALRKRSRSEINKFARTTCNLL